MLNNREDFATAYSDLLSRHDYRSLVSLLSSTTFTNDEAKRTADNLIAQFTEQADIEDKLLEGSDENTRKAYNFMTSGPSQADMSDETSPSFRFMKAWNALGDDNGVIKFRFNTESEYNNFLSALGGNEKTIREQGIELGSNYSISFNTDIEDKVSIFNALDKSHVLDNMRTRLDNARRAETNAYYTPGSDLYGATKEKRDASSDYYSNFATQLKAMKEVVDESNAKYEALMANTKPYLSEMIVSGYMGEDDKKLQQALANGMLELNVFKEMRSILEERYNRVLQTKSLSQFDVWAMNEDNEGSQVLQKLDDNIMKSELDLEINQAISDNRLHFSHASNGIDIGTMIVIDPKIDKNGKVVGDSKPRRFFVKDLFRSQAENALRDDTQTAAQMQYAKHQTYKHTYRGTDGSTITDWNPDTDSAIYTDKNGVQQVVGKAQALDILDNDIIAKRMVSYYDLANQVDKDGNGYTPEYFKIYGGNGFNSADLYNNISARCLAAMAQKYQGQSQEYIKYKANELVSTILKGLGVNFDNDILQSNSQNVTQVLLQNRGANIN